MRPVAAQSKTTLAAPAKSPAKTPAKMPAKMPAKASKAPAKAAREEKAIEMEEVEETETEEDWSVEEAMVKKIRATFQKQSEGEAELGVGKAMKVFLKSEVKPKDVGAM